MNAAPTGAEELNVKSEVFALSKLLPRYFLEKVETDDDEDVEEDDATDAELEDDDGEDDADGNAAVTTAGIADSTFAYFAVCILPPRYFSRKVETDDGEEEGVAGVASAAAIVSLRPVTNDTGGLDDVDVEDVVAV